MVSESYRFPPLLGPIDFGPMNKTVAKENHIASVCGNRNGVDEIRVKFIGGQMRCGACPGDMFPRSLFMTAGGRPAARRSQKARRQDERDSQQSQAHRVGKTGSPDAWETVCLFPVVLHAAPYDAIGWYLR